MAFSFGEEVFLSYWRMRCTHTHTFRFGQGEKNQSFKSQLAVQLCMVVVVESITIWGIAHGFIRILL